MNSKIVNHGKSHTKGLSILAAVLARDDGGRVKYDES